MCDFEKDICLWTNVQTEDDFDWLRSKGSTGSQFTGPSIDHTTSTTSGYYMFIETSAPRVKGDKARLASQVYPPSNTVKCFNFYYHMNGADIGFLNAYILLNQSASSFSSEALVWTLSGDQSDQWSLGQFNISIQYTSQPYQVSGSFRLIFFTFEFFIT